jgi:predicted transcriptional regulator
MRMTLEQQEKLTQDLRTAGYNDDEIAGIFESFADEQAGRVYSAEEVYKELLAKRKVHA